jgi:hypothetical protein
VECDIGDAVFVCGLVVLDQSLSADIPNVNRHVFGAACDAGAVRMEFYAANCLLVFVKPADLVPSA